MAELNNVNWRDFEKVILFIGCKFQHEEGDQLYGTYNPIN